MTTGNPSAVPSAELRSPDLLRTTQGLLRTTLISVEGPLRLGVVVDRRAFAWQEVLQASTTVAFILILSVCLRW